MTKYEIIICLGVLHHVGLITSFDSTDGASSSYLPLFSAIPTGT